MIIPLPFFHLIVAALYFAGAGARWRASRKFTGEISPRELKVVYVMATLTLGLHAFVLIQAIGAPNGLNFSVGNMSSLTALLCVMVAWASGLMRMLSGFSSLLMLCAGVAVLMPVVFPGDAPFHDSSQTWLALHIAIAFLAYALFCVASLLALSMVGMEKRLRHGIAGRLPGRVRVMPLLTLERYLFRLIMLGFILLTLTILSGAFFSDAIFGQPFTLSHKTSLSIISWFVFGTLLFGRWRFGWRGRRAFYWILTGTALLMLAYLGYKFMTEIVM